MKTLLSAIVAALALGVTACGGMEDPESSTLSEIPAPDEQAEDPAQDTEEVAAPYWDEKLSGAFGPAIVGNVGDVYLEAGEEINVVLLTPTASRSSVLIEVEDALNGGAAMNMVTIDGGFLNPELLDGEPHTFPQGAKSYVIGCSGSSLNSFAYDRHSDSMTIEADDQGDRVVFDYSATFPSTYSQEAGEITGRFTIDKGF